MRAHKIEGAEAQRRFILAGCAKFTVANPETGGRFTFRVELGEEDERYPGDAPWFVSVLSGPDNCEDYRYIGMIGSRGSTSGRFVRTGRSTVAPTAPSFRAFSWLWSRVSSGRSIDPAVLRHEGRCGRCSRPLTVPESIDSGLGPYCAAKVAS